MDYIKIITYYLVTGDKSVFLEHILQGVIIEIVSKVLNVDVSEQFGLLTKFLLAFFPGDKLAHEYLNKILKQ